MELEHYGKCTILAGVSGSGKTRYSESLEASSVFSTDDFWVKDSDEYAFDPTRISEAHDWNFRRFIAAVKGLPELIAANAADGATDEDLAHLATRHYVVDNTNTTVAELAPYYMAAQAFGLAVEVHVVLCPWHKAFARNIHGLAELPVYQQSQRLDTLVATMPPWWKKQVIWNG